MKIHIEGIDTSNQELVDRIINGATFILPNATQWSYNFGETTIDIDVVLDEEGV